VKGVTFIRVKLRPVAECQHVGCGWTFEGKSYIRPQTVRSNAEHHVQQTGHIVNVTVSDITEYAPDREPAGQVAP
jgi:hypothetical protein